MENRDYLMAQIEQIGKAMASAISKLITGKDGPLSSLIEETSQDLISSLDCDVFELIPLSKDEKVVWLKSKQIPFENAEDISNYFYQLYLVKAKNGISALKAAKDLLVIVDQQTKSFSMNRAKRMMEIDRILTSDF